MADKPALDLEVKVSGIAPAVQGLGQVAKAEEEVGKAATKASEEMARAQERNSARMQRNHEKLIDDEVAGVIKAQQAKKAEAAKALELAAANQKAAGATKSLGDELKGLGGRNNNAKDFIEGLSTAASGGANAFFGLAKSARAAWAIFTGSPIGALVGVLGLAASAAIAFGSSLFKAKKSAEEVAAEIENVKKKAEELANSRAKTFEDELKAIANQAAEATRKIDQLANARERISDAVLGRQLQEIEADPNLTDQQKNQKAEATRKAREKEKADNEIKDQRAKLQVEKDELAKQQAAAAELERAAKASRERANNLQLADTKLKGIPERLVETNERVREAGGGDFQVEQAIKPILDERRALANQLKDGALQKAEATAAADLAVANKGRQDFYPQFDKVRQMQQVIDVEVATRKRVQQVESTKGPLRPQLKDELLRATTNDIFNNGNQRGTPGSGGFINGEFVREPQKRFGPGTIDGQPIRDALKGPNQLQRSGIDEVAQDIKAQEPVDVQPAADAVKEVATAIKAKADEGNTNVQQAATSIRESAAAIPAPVDVGPVAQEFAGYHVAVVQKFQQSDQKLAAFAREIAVMKQQIQSAAAASK